ncbi:MAG: hypothetical protein V2B15_21390 [Bacteroidota bacterium]
MKQYVILVIGFLVIFNSLCNCQSRNSDRSKIRVDTLLSSNTGVSIQMDGEVYVIKETKIEKKSDSTIVEFVGNTEIQKVITEGSDVPANAGIGVRFTKIYGSSTRLLKIGRLESDISISIASNVDTIKAIINDVDKITNVSDFGNSILLPISSGQSVSMGFRAFIDEDIDLVLLKNFGIQGGIAASNRIWSLENSSHSIATLAFTIGVFSEFIPRANMNDFSISLGLDFSARRILGDIGHPNSKSYRNDIIGTEKTYFPGFEPNITIRLKDIKAIASFPVLYVPKNKGEVRPEVPGLTGGQFVTMIKFTGGFPIKISGNGK